MLSVDEYVKKLRQEVLVRGYSLKTFTSYSFFVKEFLEKYCFTSLNLSKSTVKAYVLYQIEGGRGGETIRLSVSALTFFARAVLGWDSFVLDTPLRPKKKKTLPKVLPKEEILKMIELTTNIKHKLVLQLLYSSGLRLSELIALKRSDLNFYDSTLRVNAGKGDKDRITIFSESLKNDLLTYISQTIFTTHYLFEGRRGKYSAKTVQKIVENAAQKVKEVDSNSQLPVRVHPHMLRHSFATHLLESGTDIRLIQKLLGHLSVRTTQGYTYVATTNFSKIKNPLDD
ncbi:MAG: tyrosine-type recombinase/integrase [Candidatus Nanoarchaeia archaeon]